MVMHNTCDKDFKLQKVDILPLRDKWCSGNMVGQIGYRVSTKLHDYCHCVDDDILTGNVVLLN